MMMKSHSDRIRIECAAGLSLAAYVIGYRPSKDDGSGRSDPECDRIGLCAIITATRKGKEQKIEVPLPPLIEESLLDADLYAAILANCDLEYNNKKGA